MRAFAARASPRALVPPCAPLSKRHRGSLAICVVRRAPGRGVRVVIANASSNADTSRLDRAFAFAEEYTKHSSATFYFATRLMNLDTRRKVWAIYAWCRALDETVDGIEARNAGSAPAAMELRAIETRLKTVFDDENGTTTEIFTPPASDDTSLISTALAHTVATTPGMTVAPFLDMIAGMRQDLDDQVTFPDWPSLRLYCYRVAGTVGLMTLPVLGIAEGYTITDATGPGVDLGIALQLCNIVRDVGEDARTRGRVYLPNDLMRKHGVTRQDILKGAHQWSSIAAGADSTQSQSSLVNSQGYKNLVEEMIQLAEFHFDRAASGTKMLAPAARLPVLAAAEMYGALLQKVREAKYDNVTKRAYTTTLEKFGVLPKVMQKAFWFT